MPKRWPKCRINKDQNLLVEHNAKMCKLLPWVKVKLKVRLDNKNKMFQKKFAFS